MQKYAPNMQKQETKYALGSTDMQKYAIICRNMQTYMQKYVKIRAVSVKIFRNMRKICTKYAIICNKICNHMQTYAQICILYAKIYTEICQNKDSFSKNMQKYAKTCMKYAQMCSFTVMQ